MFNLIAPLQPRPALAAALVKSVTGRDVEVEEAGVRLEDTPGHLGDATGLDASIRYRTGDGRRGVLVSRPSSRSSSPRRSTGWTVNPATAGLAGQRRRPSTLPPLESLTDARWNSSRNQMLCEAIANHEQREMAEQLVLLLLDDAAETAAVVGGYAGLLRRADAVVARTLADIMDVLERASDRDDATWLERFRVRYLDLSN